MADAIDAASLLLMRAGVAGPELLIVERAANLAFGAGAFAFPGGRVDPADRALAARFPKLDVEDATHRIAALRETAEETGIDLRAALPALEPMTLFARWCPPASDTARRRFDTRFYLAEARYDCAPRADGGEIVDAFWARPQSVLDRCRAGTGRALFPTRRLLERLARFDTIAAARAEPLSLPTDAIQTVLETRTDGDWLCIPKGRGYPITEERLTDALRS